MAARGDAIEGVFVLGSLSEDIISKLADEFNMVLIDAWTGTDRVNSVLWDNVGMARSEEGLKRALELIPELRAEFWQNVRVPGGGDDVNQELEKAGRVADFLEVGELMARDALHRRESCGGHFRVEHQMPDGEAMRDDENFCYVAAWEFRGAASEPDMHKEPLTFENVELAVRSYK